MNEKEAIELLTKIREHHRDMEDTLTGQWHIQTASYLDDVLEWLQMRADIIYQAENPCEEWNTKGNAYLVPYVYKLGKEMQKQAHIELDCFVMWPVNDVVLDRSMHYAKLAKKYLKENTPKITGE